MKIRVSKEDIEKGLKSPSSNTICPVARAIRRAGIKRINVAVEHIYSPKNPERSVKLDPKANQAIVHMCNTRTMEPFTFTLLKKDLDYLLGN